MNKNIIITILIVIILGLGGYLVYDKVVKNNKVEETNESVNVENNEQQEISENSYEIFANKLKTEFSKYNDSNKNYKYIENDFVPSGYRVYLNSNGSLYVEYNDATLDNKYGEYKIADNVLSFYVINTGQDVGNMVYFINEDGTVGSADTEFEIDNIIKVNKDLGYKNIVSVVSGSYSYGITGSNGPIFIDINGNIFSSNLKKDWVSIFFLWNFYEFSTRSIDSAKI